MTGNRHPYPAIRLVVDNSGSKSSSVSGTPSSRAKRRRRMCHLPGTAPRGSHIKTALGFKPGMLSLSASRPPKRPTTSVGDLAMGTECASKTHEKQEQTVPILEPSMLNPDDRALHRADRDLMTNAAPSPAEEEKAAERAWKKGVLDRIARLLGDMGWGEDVFAGRMAKYTGKTKKAFEHYFNRTSIPAFSLYQTAGMLGVSLDYILGLDPDIRTDPAGEYAIHSERQQELRDLQAQLASKRIEARPIDDREAS